MEADKIWKQAINKLEGYLKHPAYQALVKQSSPVSLNDKQLIVNTPNDFARQWMDSNYTPILKEILREITGSELYVTFVVQNNKEKNKEKEPPPLLSYIENTPEPEENNEKIENKNIKENLSFTSLRLNPKYKFENFIVGEGNRIAHAAAIKVATSPGKVYNPLFIYGGVGLGKTHLMQAIGNFILEKTNNKANIVYITSESFINDLVNAITNNKMTEFRTKYRSVDLLLIDDIQFIGGKESIQVEFFHTFNTLYASSKQIVLTSDRLPKEIAYLEDRLRNRFEMGLITDIQPPDLETRIAILKRKRDTEGYNIDDNIIYFIAESFQSNVRELEGALTRIVANASLENKELTLAEAQAILQKDLPQEASPSMILKIVAEHYHLEIEDLTGEQRTKDIVIPRQIAMYLMKEYTNCSLRKIAQIFNKSDHSPVKNAIKNIATAMQFNSNLRNEVQKLMSKIIDKNR